MRYKALMIWFCLALLLTHCTSAIPTPEAVTNPIDGKIAFAGSTTVQPLAAHIGTAFNTQYPNVTLDIAAGGSNVGIKAIHDGKVDIGMASRELKTDEEEGIDRHQIAVDVLAVVVHESNPVGDLTTAQLRDIYLGEIVNWQEVGGPDVDIVVMMRDANSGTRGAFDEIVLDKQEPSAPQLHKALTAGDMAAMVALDTNAIGYVGFGNIEEGLKVLSVDGVPPSEENAQNGSYKLVRPLLLLAGPLSQPIAQEFITFALSPEGQQVVRDNGWVPAQ